LNCSFGKKERNNFIFKNSDLVVIVVANIPVKYNNVFFSDYSPFTEVFHYFCEDLGVVGAPEWIKIAAGTADSCSITTIGFKSYVKSVR
jgi:hypothetical protein